MSLPALRSAALALPRAARGGLPARLPRALPRAAFSTSPAAFEASSAAAASPAPPTVTSSASTSSSTSPPGDPKELRTAVLMELTDKPGALHEVRGRRGVAEERRPFFFFAARRANESIIG
jgi:hypothetical protein